MKKPRIALVVSHPIQHFCPQYASLAKSNRYDFKVFFASKLGAVAYEDPNFKQRIQWNNLRLESFGHQFLSDEAIPSDSHLDAPGIQQVLEDFNPDAVIIYGYKQQFQKRVRKWAKTNERLLYYISDSENHRREALAKRLFKSLRLRLHFRNIDRFFTVGNSNEFFYHQHGVPTHRMTRMQFSIDVEQFEPAYQQRETLRDRVRSDLKIDDQETVFVTVGKLVPWKRQRDAILAMADLDETVRAKLLVLGSGPEEDGLRQLAHARCPDRIQFAGFITPDKLPEYYSAADGYLHCSDYEPHSLAISEAIYMGLPLVISDRCGSYGPLDDLQPGVNGFVYPTGDIPSLANAITSLTKHDDLRSSFAIASRRYSLVAQSRAHDQFLVQALRADQLLTS